MNAISKALLEIKYRIPSEILRVVFSAKQDWREAPVSIDNIILSKVIRPRVMVDCDLTGGQTVVVNLADIVPKYNDNYSLLYTIPSDRLLNRSIISVLNVSYMPFAPNLNGSIGSPPGIVTALTMNNSSNIMNAGKRLGDSHSSLPSVSTAQVEIVGDNVVIVRDSARSNMSYQLRCIVGNDPNMDNLSPRSYHVFCKLCELAVKSYIYKEMLVKMDTGYLQGGQELGSFKNYIETLQDAEEMYQTELNETWGKVSMMNDVIDHSSFIRSMINIGI